MISLQIINKVLQTQDFSLVADNSLTAENFVGYEQEFEFIKNHYDTYGKVPDKATFLDKFQDFSLVEVNESDVYLLETLHEEMTYYKSVAVVQKVADLLKVNANDAVEYLRSEFLI